jgi:hypothetical protein
MGETLVYIGAAIIFVWGVGHLAPTRSIAAGFGEISADNRRTLVMEWVAEGLTLCFLGVLAALVVAAGGLESQAGRVAVRAAAGMLFALAALSAATGARTSVGPMRACPIVKSVVAALYLIGLATH